MALSSLTDLLPQPIEPYRSGVPDSWSAVEVQIGTVLPRDYMDFINTYGSGIVCGVLRICSPFSPDANVDLSWIEGVLGMYNVMRENAPDPSKIPLFPEARGLLPCGKTENGGAHLMWEVENRPDMWRMTILDGDRLEVEYFDCNMTDFIAKLINGEISARQLNYTDFRCSNRFESFGAT